MNIGLYQNAASLGALERWQDAVTKNITSSQINGYKRRTVQMGGQAAGETFPDASALGRQAPALAGVFPEARYAISFHPGENHPTRRDLDLALSGPGFFHLQMPDGGLAYSRAGQFSINADRILVSGQGMELLSTDGAPLQLASAGVAPTIEADGTVKQGGETIGQLAVSQPDMPTRMIPLVAGVFTAGPGANMQEVEEPNVLQGYLEASNVKPLREMIDLVNISRAYEANHKLIQTRDEMLGKTLESLL
jgi:flagellar basal-body rod protein FlgF